MFPLEIPFLSYSTKEIRPVNEALMLARWKLGRLLSEIERAQGARTDLTSFPEEKKFGALLETLGMKPKLAMEAQRIGTLPDDVNRVDAVPGRGKKVLTALTSFRAIQGRPTV
jgi:hypothetical protein